MGALGCHKPAGQEEAKKDTHSELKSPEDIEKEKLARSRAETQEWEDKVKQRDSKRFAKEVELSRTRAEREFPELGQNGTDLNREFIRQAALLEQNNSRELNMSDWPYTLALRLAQDLQRKKRVEGSKMRAVSEFPDLRIAGSELNREFLRKVKLMQDTSDMTLENVDWPYAIASKIASEIYNPARIYSIAELQNLQEMPIREIHVRGLVTDLDRSGLSTSLAGQIILDRSLQCEFALSNVNFQDTGVSITRKGDTLYIIQRSKGAKAISERPLYRIGQEATITGKCTRRVDGKLIFKFEADRSGY